MRISLSAKAAKGVGFEDLGMEATYEFEVRDMPFTVVMDSSGTSVHQTGPREWQGRGRWSTSWPCRAAAMASSNPCCGASSRRWLPKPRAQAQQAAGDPAAAPTETVDEALWLGRRLVVAHNPERAAEQAAQRQGRIAELQARAQALSDKLDAQDEGQRSRGRALSDSGAKARFFHEVAQAHLATTVKVDLKSDLFAYEIDDAGSIGHFIGLSAWKDTRWQSRRSAPGSVDTPSQRLPRRPPQILRWVA